jgi:hypothetical protein
MTDTNPVIKFGICSMISSLNSRIPPFVVETDPQSQILLSFCVLLFLLSQGVGWEDASSTPKM